MTDVHLVLGDTNDEHAQHVLKQLQVARRDAVILDTRWFPTSATIAWEPSRRTGELRLPGGRRVPLATVRSVYWRNYFGVASPPLPDPDQDYIAHNDTRSLIDSLLDSLPCRWVNGWSGFQLHQRKPAALARVAELAVPIPATVCTNDPGAVRRFAARHPQVIFKPVQGGAHARRLTPEHLSDQHLLNLQVAPITVQEEIVGTSIRVFVAGSRVHACEIRTSELDFRDDRNPELVPLVLDEEFKVVCQRIAARLDLLWTGIDFIRRSDGQFVFLEANPSPMFIGFERATGLPLTESLIQLLLEERAEGA
jgi:glutathione synthase/RimK-type ligase-like ATP-grasp enzyme